MKKLIFTLLAFFTVGLINAQLTKADFDKLDQLVHQVAIHATDIYHTQWPADSVRPYVVKGFEQVGEFVDSYETAILALEKELESSDVFNKLKTRCPDSLDWNEVETTTMQRITEAKELAGYYFP